MAQLRLLESRTPNTTVLVGDARMRGDVRCERDLDFLKDHNLTPDDVDMIDYGQDLNGDYVTVFIVRPGHGSLGHHLRGEV